MKKKFRDKGKRILVVEDDVRYRRTISQYLSRSHRVVPAGSLLEARRLMRNKGLFDVIITDVRLDNDDETNREGLVLLEDLQDLYPSLPVIVMTAYGDSQTVYSRRHKVNLDARELGARHVLSKPLDLDKLESILDSLPAERVITPWERVRTNMSQWIPPLIVFAGVLSIWECIVRVFDIPEYLIPAPSKIWETLVSEYAGLLKDTGITLLEAFLGFMLANMLSLIIAVIFCHYKWFEKSFYPYTIALKSVPVIAIAPILVLWFGYGIVGKVVMAAIISFFPLVVNATQGLKSVDPEALDLMHSLSASRIKILIKLRFPNALPYIFSALKISSALSVVGAIVAELTGAKSGIGFTIMIATFNVDTPMLFSAIVAASLGGILFFKVVSVLEERVLKRRGFEVFEGR